MTEITTGKSDHSLLDFYVLGSRLVVINRMSVEGWLWNKGSWQSGLSLPHRCHTEGRQISEAEMARLFPAAALALLECEDETEEEAG